jgi:hypothetical protein
MKKNSSTSAPVTAVLIPAPAPVNVMTEAPAPVMPAAPVELTDAEKLAAALAKVAELTSMIEKSTAPVVTAVTAPGIALGVKYFTDGKSHIELRNIASGALITEFPADEASAWAAIAYDTDRKEVATEFRKTLGKKAVTLASGAVVQLATLDSTKTALLVQWESPTMDCQAQMTFARVQRRIRHAQEWIDLKKKQAEEEAADTSPFLVHRKYSKAEADATAPVVTAPATAAEEL